VNRIDHWRQSQKKGLFVYLMAGYPTLSLTVPLMEAVAKGGADLIELGMPFSDPIADGPVIQKAGEVALTQGTGVDEVLATVAQFRKRYEQTPVVLMGYANPVAAMGYDRFAIKAAEAGVDAVLIVDLPPFREEEKYFLQHGIYPIHLLAPTSSEARIQEIATKSQGFIYYVALKGVTGAQNAALDTIVPKVTMIKRYTSLPVAVGFGIKEAHDAAAIADVADAVVVGTRLVQIAAIESDAETILKKTESFVRALKTAINKGEA
jgi:tryptophan synthase alpha chain